MNHKKIEWYKCDFHLHTSSSSCFADTESTPQAFIEKVIEENLNCIAITNHNTGRGIDEIKVCASQNGIVVFPGVEITCGNPKIHLLVIFDTDKSSSDIERFLIELGVRRTDAVQEQTLVHIEVFDVLKSAKEVGAIVIPAHIDEYNGLSYLSAEMKKKCFESELILGVEFIHEDLLYSTNNASELERILALIKKYYCDESITIDKMKAWESCSGYLGDIAKLTFSDNPLGENSPKHGLWGIGKKYSWIKMNETPNLESFRQALLVPQLRIRTCYESIDIPYEMPDISENLQ